MFGLSQFYVLQENNTYFSGLQPRSDLPLLQISICIIACFYLKKARFDDHLYS